MEDEQMRYNSLIYFVIIVFSLGVLTGASTASADTLEVCSSGCPYVNIQDAIDDARPWLDEVLVKDGTYFENIDFDGKPITVRSENGSASTIINGGASGSVVTFENGEGPFSLLEGFTLTNGTGTHFGSGYYVGGGIYIFGASPSILGCTVTGSALNYLGGGIYMEYSSATIAECTISGNNILPNGDGAGIYVEDSSPTISNSTISGNTGDSGAGIYFTDSSGIIQDCDIINNTADYYGGGIYMDGATTKIMGTNISGNEAQDDYGGGIYLDGYSDPWILHSTISGNNSDDYGGGIYNDSYSRPIISGSVISGNWVNSPTSQGGGIFNRAPIALVNSIISGNAADQGGGIYTQDDPDQSFILNCTISGNKASGGGGIYGRNYGANPPIILQNNIVWGNSPDQITDVDGALSVTYSDVQGGYAGDGNMDSVPNFFEPRPSSAAPTSEGDYHIMYDSPCIDQGFPVEISMDIDGEARPNGEGVDMGADEFHSLCRNGSFEGGDRIPEPWLGKKLGKKDGRDCEKAKTGSCSFKITGSRAGKFLVQTREISGPAGSPLLLSGYSRAQNPTKSGGAYRIDLMIYHTDGSREKCKVGFAKRTHGWQYKEKTCVPIEDYNKIKVILRYARQTGKAWFDDIQLVRQ
jgi:parallel beta-helix repeat protein